MRPIVLAGLAGCGALAAGFFATGLISASAKETVRLRPDDPAEVALGADVYDENCAVCHGTGLQGQPDWRSPGPDGLLPAPPHDRTGHTWHHDDDTLFTLTRDGLAALLGPDATVPSGMPAFGDVLTDEEIRAALSYIKSTWPANVRAMHDEINARAADR